MISTLQSASSDVTNCWSAEEEEHKDEEKKSLLNVL